jgi:hypothetical protein
MVELTLLDIALAALRSLGWWAMAGADWRAATELSDPMMTGERR